MKLIKKTFKHVAEGFCIKITTCNKKVATALDVDTGEQKKFNRQKLEWMINKNIFVEI